MTPKREYRRRKRSEWKKGREVSEGKMIDRKDERKNYDRMREGKDPR